jgi:hypothetical protein
MLSSKIHTALTALAAAVVVAAVSAAGVTDAASALPVQRISVVASRSHLVVPVVHDAAVKSAGSAGIKGYGDDTCESLANDYNTAVNASEEGLAAGDAERTEQNGQLANRIYAQLTDNCMVIE